MYGGTVMASWMDCFSFEDSTLANIEIAIIAIIIIGPHATKQVAGSDPWPKAKVELVGFVRGSSGGNRLGTIVLGASHS
jgi:hypothetical protein